MKIGEVLKELRVSKNLTQVQVSQRTRISQTFLSQIETGAKSPSKQMMKILCDLYNIPPVFVAWKATTENDVQKKKVGAFRKIKPAMDKLIDEFLN